MDDLDFSKSPTNTFLDHTGREKSYMDYYREQYNIQIKDPKQPLLLSRSKVRQFLFWLKIIVLTRLLCGRGRPRRRRRCPA